MELKMKRMPWVFHKKKCYGNIIKGLCSEDHKCANFHPVWKDILAIVYIGYQTYARKCDLWVPKKSPSSVVSSGSLSFMSLVTVYSCHGRYVGVSPLLHCVITSCYDCHARNWHFTVLLSHLYRLKFTIKIAGKAHGTAK